LTVTPAVQVKQLLEIMRRLAQRRERLPTTSIYFNPSSNWGSIKTRSPIWSLIP